MQTPANLQPVTDERVILATCPYSNHPGDYYLHVVLALKFDTGQYVTWVHNSECGGLYHGHYFSSHEEALADWEERGMY